MADFSRQPLLLPVLQVQGAEVNSLSKYSNVSCLGNPDESGIMFSCHMTSEANTKTCTPDMGPRASWSRQQNINRVCARGIRFDISLEGGRAVYDLLLHRSRARLVLAFANLLRQFPNIHCYIPSAVRRQIQEASGPLTF